MQTNQKGVRTAVKRQPVGSVHAYWSDDSGDDILMLTWISVGEVHTQVMPFHKNYVYMLHAQYTYVHIKCTHTHQYTYTHILSFTHVHTYTHHFQVHL